MEDKQGPIAGIDYPRTFNEFNRFFTDEASCRAYIARLRWPNGYQCLKCGSKASPWVTSRGYIHCRQCESEISVTARTIFEDTRNPLKTWFLAMWFVTSQKHGASALGLQRVLGLGSYQTAWTWLHKLRRAMIRPGRTRLNGHVEVDETYIGGAESGGKRGRGAGKKEIVAIAIEIHIPKGFGRVRMRRIPNVSGASLIPFVCDFVEPGSVILTDGWKGYNDLPKHGYVHNKTILSNTGDPAHVAMPGVHRVSSLLKRWLLSTHQGAVSSKHLDYYLDEYTFRFNRRLSHSRGLLFYRLMEQAVVTAPTSYRNIVDVNHNI
jgi:transposase-like protein/DNA-directed RNA polymerase subunit RPC12/RpoP